jgi:hypothetical protein
LNLIKVSFRGKITVLIEKTEVLNIEIHPMRKKIPLTSRFVDIRYTNIIRELYYPALEVQ